MKKLFLLLAVLCMLTGCSSACAELSNAALLSDYDEALRILEENNPFLPLYRQYIPDLDRLARKHADWLRSAAIRPGGYICS